MPSWNRLKTELLISLRSLRFAELPLTTGGSVFINLALIVSITSITPTTTEVVIQGGDPKKPLVVPLDHQSVLNLLEGSN